MTGRRLNLSIVVAFLAIVAAVITGDSVSAEGADATASSAAPVFESDVAPILRAYCWKCHGGEGRAGGLDMRSVPLLLAGGKGGPAIVAGSPEKSPIFQRLNAGEMPPGTGLKPSVAHLDTIRLWITTGAGALYRGDPTETRTGAVKDRDWWSFRKPVRRTVPTVRQRDRVRTPIDAFLLRELEEKSLSFSPDADRLTLIRRVSLDLIGLPPSPREVDEFLSDRLPGAYQRLIERLLASPHYGERWGRHWLDSAGYVDTIGTDNDAAIIEPHERMWTYRDYVIRSFNHDKPYDSFLREQLAGDELVEWRSAKAFTPEIKDLLTATGFLRQAADVTYAPELNTADIRHQVLFDTVQIVGSGVLGLTMHCAQCHAHKFDPISHADYYRFAAFFTPAYDVLNWKHSKERFLVDVSVGEKRAIDEFNAGIDQKIGVQAGRIAELRRAFERRLFASKVATLPEVLRSDAQAALSSPPEKRTEVQRYLAEKLGPLLKVSPDEVERAIDAPARKTIAESNRVIAELNRSKRSYNKIPALWDLGPPPPTYLYRRGDFRTPGALVAPGVPAVLDERDHPFTLSAPEQGASTSGRRLALAKWLTRSDHPLTSRVIVNRVWQQYFGTGIVATPDNFGLSGASPSHPELLDWLATEFVANGWRFKTLHRLILQSTAYRQSSRAAPLGWFETDPATVDPDNVLLWRMPLRRLESEAVRDGVLTVSGVLDRGLFGPPLPLKPQPDGRVDVDGSRVPASNSPFRRSLYLLNRRNYHPTDLNLFDQPVVAHNCTRRDRTAVVLQSLAMLNGPFILEQSARFANRVKLAEGSDRDHQIELAYRLALCRPPDCDELATSREFLSRQAARHQAHGQQPSRSSAADAALANLCQMLLNTNEFLYIP